MINKIGFEKILIIFGVISMFCSCVPRKSVVYFIKEDTTQRGMQAPYEPVIQANNRIQVLVTSIDKAASSFFSFSSNDNSSNSPSYLVNAQGFIDMPVIGLFHVAGLTTTQAKDSLKKTMEKYITSPTVIVTLKTFRVVMLGAIGSPGILESDHERLTILEAIAMAGDLSINAKRENIMIVREKGEGKEYGFVDITSKAIMTSPYYNLHANDIVYIEPNERSRLNALQPYYAVFGILLGLYVTTLVFVKK